MFTFNVLRFRFTSVISLWLLAGFIAHNVCKLVKQVLYTGLVIVAKIVIDGPRSHRVQWNLDKIAELEEDLEGKQEIIDELNVQLELEEELKAAAEAKVAELEAKVAELEVHVEVQHANR